MKVLLLHPDDSPWSGSWNQSRWDLIVDLGFASPYVYEDWSRRSGARVLSIYHFAGETQSFRWVNSLLEHGRGRLFDRMGLDWWEILGVWSYQHLQWLYLLEQLRPEISVDRVEILAASRPHPFARILGLLLNRSIQYSETEHRGPTIRLSRMLGSLRKLRPEQIPEIAFDKWDPAHQLRRHLFRRRRARLSDPVTLLPSAYSNVTKTYLAYAGQLPDRKFLLVTTRHSAVPHRLPENVMTVPLAAYALASSVTRDETIELRNAWDVFLPTLTSEMESLQRAARAGFLDYFPAHLRTGLLLREAWKEILNSEPVKGVLCGDDLNYHTRLPLILAKRNGLNAVYCSHGALDGGFLFKLPYADTFLVKGEMESDYLQRACAISPDQIELAAPGSIPASQGADPERDALVFFSQPFEVEGGRADKIYREIVPRLLSAARQSGRKLVVKLHPFESKQARSALVASVLPGNTEFEIISGAPPEEIMSRAWCGVTIDSSVAVECALRQIPFFLCGWLDFMGVGYLRQFARYGVAQVLETPDSLERIPEFVAAYHCDPQRLDRLWHPADPVRLEEILFSSRPLTSSIHVRADT
jgi:hypothetical protein